MCLVFQAAAPAGGATKANGGSALDDLVDLNFGNPATQPEPPMRTAASLDPWSPAGPPSGGGNLDPWGTPAPAVPVQNNDPWGIAPPQQQRAAAASPQQPAFSTSPARNVNSGKALSKLQQLAFITTFS